MRLDEDDQIKLVRLLGPRLAAKRLSTRIYVHDHNWVLHPNDRKVVGGDAKLAPIDSVAKIMSDPEAGKYIAGSSWHCYAGGVGEMRRAYDSTHRRFPDRQILTTELSGWGKSRGGWWGDLEWGMAQVSRAARPGAKRIGVTIASGAGAGLDLVAFELVDERTSLVAFNRREGEAEFQVGSVGGFFAYRLSGRSIATFVW